MTWLRRKSIDRITQHEEGRRLVPTLSWPHLVALGIGAIVGTGIYTLIGGARTRLVPPCCCPSSSPAWSAPAQHWPMRNFRR